LALAKLIAMNGFFRFKYFIVYQWRAKTKYYLHSPFVYQFYLNVLEGKEDNQLQAITALRNQLHNNNAVIHTNDLGTGTGLEKKVSDLESKVAVRPKYGRLLYRLVKYFNAQNILELGTSIGVSTSYLAMAKPDATVNTMEGSAALVDVAKQNYDNLGIKNITTHTGNFDDLLPSFLKTQPALGLVFFDGNHTREATLRYFKLCLEKANEESVFVFDDIHWSEEMHAAWQEIKAHPEITLAIDVFQFGICFFRKEKLSKEEFILRY